jgi:predicted metal-dependent hydrolase
MATPTTLSMPRVRNLRFQIDAAVPRHWHGGRRAITLFFDNLSLLFPVGERFFIASVRAHAASIQEDPLKREVEAFCAQEGVHCREHARYNQRLAEHGYPAVALERRLSAALQRTARLASRHWRLAITCALEHFTAVMGHILLSDDRLLHRAHPEMAALWRWHAIEETEHKAVAFDVYRAAGGGYLGRVLAMSVTTVMFWWHVGYQQIRLMHADGCLLSLREWGSLLKFLFIHPGGMFQLWRQWFRYYQPGFHPSNLDNRELLESSLRELGRTRVRFEGDPSPLERARS